MSHLSHVLLAGSLLIGQEALSQTTPTQTSVDKATIASATRVQEVLGQKNTPAIELATDSKHIINSSTILYTEDKAYKVAVEQVQAQLAGALSFEMSEWWARVGLGNNPIGTPSGALVIGKKLLFDDRKASGKWEMGLGRTIFIKAQVNF